MLSNHLIFCCPLLLLPSIFPSIRVFSSESALQIKWPSYWSFSFNISPSNEYSGLIFFRIDWFDLSVQGTLKSHLTAIPNKKMDQTWPPNLPFDYPNHCDFMKYQLASNFRSWLIFHCFHMHTVLYLLLETQRWIVSYLLSSENESCFNTVSCSIYSPEWSGAGRTDGSLSVSVRESWVQWYLGWNAALMLRTTFLSSAHSVPLLPSYFIVNITHRGQISF